MNDQEKRQLLMKLAGSSVQVRCAACLGEKVLVPNVGRWLCFSCFRERIGRLHDQMSDIKWDRGDAHPGLICKFCFNADGTCKFCFNADGTVKTVQDDEPFVYWGNQRDYIMLHRSCLREFMRSEEWEVIEVSLALFS